MAAIAIVGTGYVGLCTGLVFAQHGHDVTFVDVDPAKLKRVEEGRAPFYEPGIDELLGSVRARVRTTTDLASAVAASDFTFLCVGTPQSADGAIDLTYIRKAAADVGAALPRARRGHVLVTKSTVIPGTADDVVRPEAEKASGLRAGIDFHVASNPEFLKEGSAVQDALRPDRVVAGAHDAAVARRLLDLYEGLPGERLATTPKTAEMIKYAANAFLATKIAFANEMANVCERIGVDWTDVARGIGPDPRIGPLFLRAGIGFGGSCFPKDVAAITHAARQTGAPSRVLEAVLAHNAVQVREAVRMLEEEVGSLQGKRVALLGLAFKQDTDDVRETRSLPLWRSLREAGADVICHDPQAGPAFHRLAPDARIAASLDDALRGADALVLATEWSEYRDLDPQRVRSLMRGDVVVDGRRVVPAARFVEAGLRIRAIGFGRPSA